MSNLNKVLLIGRLGKDPELKTTQNGKAMVNLTLATSEKYKDRSGNKQESTEWHRVVLWEKLAEIVCKYCHKGSRLYVEGSLKTREWKDKEGNRRFTTEIVGRNVQLFDFKNGNDRQSQPTKQSNHSGYEDGLF